MKSQRTSAKHKPRGFGKLKGRCFTGNTALVGSEVEGEGGPFFCKRGKKFPSKLVQMERSNLVVRRCLRKRGGNETLTCQEWLELNGTEKYSICLG